MVSAIKEPKTPNNGKNKVRKVEIAGFKLYFSIKILGIQVVTPSLTKLFTIAKTASMAKSAINPFGKIVFPF